MEINCFAQNQPVAARAYVMQYVSLIMIILTFVIGAFASQKISEKAKNQVKQGAPRSEFAVNVKDMTDKRDWLASVINYDDLFSDTGVTLDGQKVEALAELLKSHDINSEISIFSYGDTRTALKRSLAISRELEDSGVPTAALQVLVKEQTAAGIGNEQRHQVQLRFWHSNSGNAGKTG